MGATDGTPATAGTTGTPDAAPATEHREARGRLVAAGISLVDELPLSRAITAPTAAVAERAGVTTGSFFHHFPTAAAFAEAMVLEHLETPDDGRENLDDLVASLTHIDLLEIVRSSLTDTWQVYLDGDIRQRYRVAMALWAHHRHPLERAPDGYDTVGAVLRASTRVRQDEAADDWRAMLGATGREIVEPFDVDRLATALSALFQGLLVRHEIDPDAVDDALFADTSAALITALTVPAGSRIQLRDLMAPLEDLGQLSPQARSGARRRRETRDRVVAAIGEMFGPGWEAVSTSQVAARAGVSNQTIVNLFGSPRGVAAATFGRFVGEIRQAGAEPGERRRSSRRCGPPRSARSHPGALGGGRRCRPRSSTGAARRAAGGRAASSRTAHRHGHPPRGPPRRADRDPLGQLDLGGQEPLDVATMLINFVIAQALMRPTATRRDRGAGGATAAPPARRGPASGPDPASVGRRRALRLT